MIKLINNNNEVWIMESKENLLKKKSIKKYLEKIEKIGK